MQPLLKSTQGIFPYHTDRRFLAVLDRRDLGLKQGLVLAANQQAEKDPVAGGQAAIRYQA